MLLLRTMPYKRGEYLPPKTMGSGGHAFWPHLWPTLRGFYSENRLPLLKLLISQLFSFPLSCRT